MLIEDVLSIFVML